MIWKSNVHNGPDTASPAVQKSCKMQQQGIKKRLQSFCNALMNSQNEITSYIQKANKFAVPDFQLKKTWQKNVIPQKKMMRQKCVNDKNSSILRFYKSGWVVKTQSPKSLRKWEPEVVQKYCTNDFHSSIKYLLFAVISVYWKCFTKQIHGTM